MRCRMEERMKQRRQEREEKEKKVRFSEFPTGMASVLALLLIRVQEAIEREKIRRKGGKDITDLKQK